MPAQPTASVETTMDGINSLRAHVDARFQAFEGWLERISTAVERLSENRERIVALESKYDTGHEHTERRLRNLEDQIVETRIQGVRNSIMCSGFMAVALIAIELVVRKMVG